MLVNYITSTLFFLLSFFLSSSASSLYQALDSRSTIVNLSARPWMSLPSQLLAMMHVTHLDINRLRLSELPDALCLMSSLTRLDVSLNRLQELPFAIGR